VSTRPELLDSEGRTIDDKSFNAYKAFIDPESRPEAIIVEKPQTHGRRKIVVSQNINGCGHRARKLVKVYETVKDILGEYPDVLLI